MALFGSLRRRDPPEVRPDRAAALAIKEWALARLGAPPGAAVTVNEIACPDPSCPGVETVILVMEPGRKTRACKIAKPLEEVTAQDVHDAVAPS